MTDSDGFVTFDNDRQRWRAVLYLPADPGTGKRRKWTRQADTKTGARQALRELRRKRDQLTASGDVRNVADLLALWLELRAPETMSPTTLETAEWTVRHLTAGLGKVPAGELSTAQVERFLRAKADAGMARRSLRLMRSHLSQAYRFGMARRVVAWNPAQAAILPRSAGQNRQRRALDLPELVALFDAAESFRLGAWVIVAGTLGLRPGEVSGLEWQDIDLDAGTVTIHQSLAWHDQRPTLKETKTGAVRILGLPARAVEALTRHRETQETESAATGDLWPSEWAGLVFRTEAGTPLDRSNTRRLVQRIADAAEIGKLAPYDLRHSATSIMAAQGVQADQLADFLGHSDTRMVWEHYRHRAGRVVNVQPVLPE